MTLRALGRVRRAVVQSARRFRRCAVILLYHRVADAEFDPQLLCVTPRHFAEHLKVLAGAAEVMSLERLAATLRERSLPRRAAVVTFDDGYADNLHDALPHLEEASFPATVFVATGCLGSQRGYWWDRLEELLLHPCRLQDPLAVTIGEHRHEWFLEDAARYETSDFLNNLGWTVASVADPTPRHCAYRALHGLLRPLDEHARERALKQIEGRREAPAAGKPRPRVLSSWELPSLVASGLVEVGAHSITHPVLAGQSVEHQEREIVGSKMLLEDVLGRRVTSFAYPYGSIRDYSDDSVALARLAGFACACTTHPASVCCGADVFQLPRMIVRDWDGDEFARRLRDWFLE